MTASDVARATSGETPSEETHPPWGLDLDPLNPRLRREEEGKPQSELLAIMVRRFRVHEIADSIVASGWLEFDPLMAVVEADDETGTDRLRVVEGNRRLAAVKLLLDPELAPEKQRARWRAMAAALDGPKRATLERLRVLRYTSRDSAPVMAYIGFRHVAGVLPWPAQEKASYIARLVSMGMGYAEVAETLGSYPAHMRRHHVAFEMLDQAHDLELDGATEMGDSFGVLLRALQADGVERFLGVEESGEPEGNKRPVPTEKQDEFGKFVRWTFGTQDSQRVLPESRRLTDWGKILSSTRAVRYLESSATPHFDRAWALSGGEREALSDALWRASYLIADVLPLLGQHRDDPVVAEAVRECHRYAAQLPAFLDDEAHAVGGSVDRPATVRAVVPGFDDEPDV